MKKLYSTIFALVSILNFAQVNISFESDEGYSLGNLNTQNGWEVTEGSDGILENQIITNEQSSEGSFSFKNSYEAAYDFQWFPIFGGAFTLENPIEFPQEFTFSYDILVTGQGQSDFEFTLYGITENEEFAPIAGVGIENRGLIYLTSSNDYDFEYAQGSWAANEWTNVKVEVTSAEIKFYLNNVLDTTIPRFNELAVQGFNFLHNNFGHDAYYDNIQLTVGNLNLSNNQVGDELKIFPNPATDMFNIQLENDEVSSILIFDNSGKLVLQLMNSNKVEFSKFPIGIYHIQITTVTGKIFNEKIVKK